MINEVITVIFLHFIPMGLQLSGLIFGYINKKKTSKFKISVKDNQDTNTYTTTSNNTPSID